MGAPAGSSLAVLGIAVSDPGPLASPRRTETITGRPDPGIVVVDEVVGQWLALPAWHSLNWKSTLAGFFLFRLFDIWKPPPVRRQLKSSAAEYGIMADDLGAGCSPPLCYFSGWFNLY